MLAVFYPVRGSRAFGQSFAAVGICSVRVSSQRAAYGSPEINTTMSTSLCNVRSLLVNRAVAACVASVDSSVFRSVGGTGCVATIRGLTHYSSGLPTAAAEFRR